MATDGSREGRWLALLCQPRSAFSFKGKSEDVRAIARALGVAAVLKRSVRKAGEQVRITA